MSQRGVEKPWSPLILPFSRGRRGSLQIPVFAAKVAPRGDETGFAHPQKGEPGLLRGRVLLFRRIRLEGEARSELELARRVEGVRKRTEWRSAA